ncbi:MAG TPA: hypothetical protein VHE33_06515 [Acidobacteriaceae bacterium]|nr:hypothetical protein [Acidobacteriaceae bacterium]
MVGTREELLALGRDLDQSGDAALQLMKKILRIRNRLGRTVGLAANQAQRLYHGRASKRNIVLKARQVGVTTWIAGRFFLRTITHPGTVTVQVAHTQEAAEQIFRIVHRFFEQLPEPLRSGVLKGAQKNARRIVFPGIDSEYLVETAGDPNAGRGLTLTNLHCTEVARWPGDAAEILYGLMATLSPDGELALESTPNGACGCFWKEWQEADRTGTVRHFFPWWVEDAYTGESVEEATITEVERQLMKEHGLTREKIGYRRQLHQSFRGLAKQEYAEDANECFLVSGECAFDLDSIHKRLAEVSAPAEIRRNGTLRVWMRPEKGRNYVVAVDPAGGGSEGDYTAMEVIDLETGLQCAELEEHLPPLETAAAAADLAREYNGALLAVERNNHGSGVLAYLGSVHRYPRLFRDRDGEGFLTSTLSRMQMIARMGSVLAETPEAFRSERLLLQCRGFIRQANGRSEAGSGEHDDCVMAMAIALAVREERLGGRKIALA